MTNWQSLSRCYPILIIEPWGGLLKRKVGDIGYAIPIFSRSATTFPPPLRSGFIEDCIFADTNDKSDLVCNGPFDKSCSKEGPARKPLIDKALVGGGKVMK